MSWHFMMPHRPLRPHIAGIAHSTGFCTSRHCAGAMIECAQFNWRCYMASRAAKNRAGKRTKQPYVGLLVFLAIVVGVLCAGGAGLWALGNEWLKDLPDYTDVDAYNTAQKTTVLASDESTVLGRVLRREPRTGQLGRGQRLRQKRHDRYGGRAFLRAWRL